jgi:micrococcal nuclease
MLRTRLNVVLFVSATIVSLALILQGCKKAEEQPQPVLQGEAPAPQQAAAPSQPGAPVATPAPAAPLPGIASADAKEHIGETNTVCGPIAGTRYLESSASKPTLLNFDHPYPDHTFSVMIPNASRAKFSEPPEKLFKGKIVCVTGAIIDYRGKPEIVVDDPSQIVIQEPAAAPAP